ncbi:hypothetical protein LVB00_18490, partial [Klebsiella pneumoniae]|nr:hypothetical protein [Klebsiella pneumoniae]
TGNYFPLGKKGVQNQKAPLLKILSMGKFENFFWGSVPRRKKKKAAPGATQTADKMQSSGLPGGAAIARAYRELHNLLILLFFVDRVRRKPPPGRKALTLTK